MKIFYKPRKDMSFCLQPINLKTITDTTVYEDIFEEETMG
jgi:hypothetical protein